MVFKSRYKTQDEMYAENDLGNNPLFPCGFINFGYWKGIDIDSKIKFSSRVLSQCQVPIF
jgi:hypothetical protein